MAKKSKKNADTVTEDDDLFGDIAPAEKPKRKTTKPKREAPAPAKRGPGRRSYDGRRFTCTEEVNDAKDNTTKRVALLFGKTKRGKTLDDIKLDNFSVRSSKQFEENPTAFIKGYVSAAVKSGLLVEVE